MSMKGQPQGIPFFMPMGYPPQEQSYVPDMSVPPRVNKAMEFLEFLAYKTQQRAAATENQIQIIDGQKLTEEEIGTQATACHLLNQYFAGKLPVDKWEEVRLIALQQKVAAKQAGGTKKPMKVLRCIICNGNDKDCPLCEGSGTLILVSTKQDVAQLDQHLPEPVALPKKKKKP